MPGCTELNALLYTTLRRTTVKMPKSANLLGDMTQSTMDNNNYCSRVLDANKILHAIDVKTLINL